MRWSADQRKLRCRRMLNMIENSEEAQERVSANLENEVENNRERPVCGIFSTLLQNSICLEGISELEDTDNNFMEVNTDEIAPSRLSDSLKPADRNILLDISNNIPSAVNEDPATSHRLIETNLFTGSSTAFAKQPPKVDFIASPTMLYINKDYDLNSVSELEGILEALEESVTENRERLLENHNEAEDDINENEINNEEQNGRNNEENVSQSQENSKSNKTLARKRSKNEDSWNDNKNKTLKNSGKAYVGVRNKKPRNEKSIGPPCNCNLKCYQNLPDEMRNKIFKRYWEIGDHERQWEFILRYVASKNIKTMSLVRKNNRTQSIEYTLPKNDAMTVKVKVCKTMFLNTLSITQQVVYTALDKLESKVTDFRGRHANRPKRLSDVAEKGIIEHINEFETVEAHYVRKDSQKLYLDETLNISRMYRLYLDWKKQKPEYNTNENISKRQYEHIFNTKFNYSFHKPKKDQCDFCHIYKYADDGRKAELQVDFEKHINSKNKVRDLKAHERTYFDSTTSVVACFDLEKVLNIPQSEVGPFHYKRKYPVYNFTVFDILENKGYCFVWHHQIAKRGAIEIASCLWCYIKSQVDAGKRKISFYSDSCTGQNRNRFVFGMFALAAKTFGIEITHRFLEKGHSQSEGDSMHATVERRKKRHTIYTPDQMYYLIENAKVTGETYTVKQMTQEDIFDFKDIIKGKNWLNDVSGCKIYWSKIKEITFSYEHPESVYFKYDFEEEQKELKVSKVNSRRRRDQADAELKKAYNGPLPVARPLYNDLISLCDTGAIPSHYQRFYRNLCVSTDTTNEESEEE